MVDYSPESEEPTFDNDHGADTAGSSATLWIWSLILAGVLYLISGSILAGAIVPVMAAVQPSFRAAKWIRRNDPESNRARACSRFLIAVGCWTALWTGLAAVLVLVAVSVFAGEEPTESQGIASLLVVVVAAVATSLIGLWAAWTAWRHRIRVWAHPKLMHLANYKFANLSSLVVPQPTCNHAVYATAISLAFPPMALGTGWMIFQALTAPPARDAAIHFVSGFSLLLGGPVLSLGVLFTMSNRLFANGPAECWATASTQRDELEE
jgi:hypothetical protein